MVRACPCPRDARTRPRRWNACRTAAQTLGGRQPRRPRACIEIAAPAWRWVWARRMGSHWIGGWHLARGACWVSTGRAVSRKHMHSPTSPPDAAPTGMVAGGAFRKVNTLRSWQVPRTIMESSDACTALFRYAAMRSANGTHKFVHMDLRHHTHAHPHHCELHTQHQGLHEETPQHRPG